VRYLPWAVLSLVAYAAVPPLVGAASNGETAIPSNVVALVSNGVLVAATAVVVVVSGESVTAHLDHPKFPLVLASGVFLSVGILAYYRALSLGPVSVVTPVFATFLVGSAVAGVVFLDEPVTIRKAAGTLLALAGVYLVTT
jgi:transporter family protein